MSKKKHRKRRKREYSLNWILWHEHYLHVGFGEKAARKAASAAVADIDSERITSASDR